MSAGRLQGKAAIVTGGAQGIGGGCARQLAAAGADVLIVDVDGSRAEETAHRIETAGGTASVFEGDVAQEETARGMVVAAVERFGRLDILVQNAFPVGSDAAAGGALEVEPGGWDTGMAVLAKAIYLGAKHAVPAMEASGAPAGFDAAGVGPQGLGAGQRAPTEVGRIVNMASVHGYLQAAGMLVYEAGKAAVIGMTRQMAIEFAPKGITVNAIAPGHVVTEKLQQAWERDADGAGYRLWELQYPVRRCGTPDDIGHAVVFLSSPEASFINGALVPVDGGLTVQIQENIVVEMKDYIRENPGMKTLFDTWGATERARR